MEASAFQRPVAARRPRPPGLQRSDATLAGRVRAGDVRAFEELYDRHAAPLLAFCRHLLGSREGAEDALQHTFLSAHRALERDGAPEHVRAWLYTIARNRCLSVLRARRDDVALDEDGAPVVSTRGLASEVEERAELRALVGDLGRLPAEQRAALVLFEFGDHSHDEIAEIIGVRREKVKALVFQAREALIGWRAARETPCADVREQLSTLRGSALRRAPLRRHVELCSGCREFDEQVRRQRACLAVVLPVVPAAGLKSAVMSSVLGGGTAAAATTA
ncbi:MAG: sigma-70 family RNA polymerase sigma factor, partial [Actinomycetota bacterium]|nr:sigma-70 family RNA polymerase sigma factor [Actinomycetota bacterium]